MSTGRLRMVLAATLALTSSAGIAEESTPQGKSSHPQPGQPPPGGDPIGTKLFPPELIMSHQQELGVDEPQRAAILKEIEKAQSQLLPLQWQMHAAQEQLAKALEAPKIDEAKTLVQADKLMTMERDLKRTHLGMLIRIRTLLTDSQRAKLTELRTKTPRKAPPWFPNAAPTLTCFDSATGLSPPTRGQIQRLLRHHSHFFTVWEDISNTPGTGATINDRAEST